MGVFLEITTQVRRGEEAKYLHQTERAGVQYFTFGLGKKILFIETNNFRFKNTAENQERLKKLLELYYK